MPAINENWYARMTDKVRTDTSRSIRKTGSEANDPFWRAREAQGIGDVQLQREEAIRALQDRMLASRARQPKTNPTAIFGGHSAPDTYLGTQPDDVQGGAGMRAPAEMMTSPGQSPDAYRLPMSGLPGGPAARAAGSPAPVAVNPVNWAARMAPPAAAPVAVAPGKPKKGVLSPQEQERQRLVSWLSAGSPMGQTNKDIEAYNLMKGKAGAGLTGRNDSTEFKDMEKADWLKRYQEALITSLATKDTTAKVMADARSVAANAQAAKVGATTAATGKKRGVAPPAVTPLGAGEEEETPGYFSNYGEKAKTVGDWIGGLFGKSVPKALTANDQAALAWANKNPNDERAKVIKKRLGVK